MSIDAIRENYDYPPLTEREVHADPIEQFRLWFDEAWRSDARQPNAMTLATCSKEGIPSARVVLLKGFDREGFVFYTNYQSAKADDLDANPNASLVFYWTQLARTVRINGTVSKVSREDTDAYFMSRPRDSQLGAWASDQSQVIDSREALYERFEHYKAKFQGRDIPTPPCWGGYVVRPTAIEFWQGQANRLHDRLRYQLKDDGRTWTLERQAP